MPRLAILEAFDAPPEPAPPPEPAGPSEDWLDGHAAGYAEAMVRAEAESGRLTADVATALSRLDLLVEEARSLLLVELAPLFEAIAGQLLPAAAQATFTERVVHDFTRAAEADLGRPLVLRVASANVAAVRAAAADSGAGLEIEADPALGPLEALVAGPGGETALDQARVLDAVQAAFDNLAPQEDRAHG